MNINSVDISGNLTRDAEKRATTAGSTVVNFGIAVNDRVLNKDTGEWEDRPNFFECVIFGNYADAIEPYLRKGLHVAIKGKLRYSQWEKDGAKRSKVEVVVEQMDFMSQPTKPKQEPAQEAYSAPQPQEVYDEEIPF